MNLNISFPDDMRTDQLLMQQRIPCLCKIAKAFEISFSDTVPESSGTVFDWDRKELEARAVAGGGGRYTHYANALITLMKIAPNTYEIIHLEMFYTLYGWCTIVEDGEYAPPGDFWDEE